MDSNTESLIIEKLIDNVLDTRFENLEQRTVESVKDRIIDVIGCTIGGAKASGNLEFVNIVKDWGGKEEATILIHGGKAPAQNVAMVNIVMARSFDFVPCSPVVDGIAAGGYISVGTIPTAIAVGEVNGINGRDLITAVAVGDDLHSRISAADYDRNMLRKSGFCVKWDSTSIMNGFGITAIAGRLLGLDKRQMRNAFGIVLHQLGGNFLSGVHDATTSFKLAQALPARDGIFSAYLARAGWTGPKDALFGQDGYYNLYGGPESLRNPQVLIKDLGKKYYSDSHIKPYPSCRSTHVPIACALAIAQNYAVDATDIREIILCLSPEGLKHTCAQPFIIGEFPHANAIWSYQFTVATALLRKSVRPEHFTEESIRDPQIGALINKIKLVELPEVKSILGTKLKVVLKDGKEIFECADVPKGDQINNPMSRDEIIAKFWTNVEFSRTITEKNARELLTLLEKLEELDDMNRIIKLLVP